MKIIRYQDQAGKIAHASLEEDGSALAIQGDILGDYSVTQEKASVAKILAPFKPTSIIGIGLNYKRHAEESDVQPPSHPIVFFKAPGTLQNPGDPIILPTHLRSDKVDYECELAVIIRSTCKNVSKDKALDYVLGYTCANDVSARDWQLEWGGSQWCRGKSFDTFLPLGPSIVTTDSIPNPAGLRIRTLLNGVTMQDWTTQDLIFDVPALISFLSGSTTLEAGTVILTGTPHGVGVARKPQVWLKPGDVVVIDIDKIGKLTNPVMSEI